MSVIKTRFAPSPTGYLHIGGARTALFAFLYAKSQEGECFLRIEDTDKERSKDEYTTEIIESFKWLGVEFDNKVVYQSNNADRYKEVIDQLLEQGSACLLYTSPNICESSKAPCNSRSYPPISYLLTNASRLFR